MTDATVTTQQTANTTTSLLPTGGAAETTQPSFLWDEGVAGTGDKPAYLMEKFKSVSEQAKSYGELEKRFGGFTGAPKDGYKLPENFSAEDTFVKELQSLGASYNMNQELHDKLLDFGAKLIDARDSVYIEQELAALGDKAEDRIKNVDGFLRNNLRENYEKHKDAISSAKVIELVEDIINSSASAARLPTQPAQPVNVPTQADIDDMMRKKDDNGRELYFTSESYRNKVREAMARMHGQKQFSYIGG